MPETETTTGAPALAAAIAQGWLIPVQVFGADECCMHLADDKCPSQGYGLCDRFSTHSPGGSDCNRAENFILRPSDAIMADPFYRAVFNEALRGG